MERIYFPGELQSHLKYLLNLTRNQFCSQLHKYRVFFIFFICAPFLILFVQIEAGEIKTPTAAPEEPPKKVIIVTPPSSSPALTAETLAAAGGSTPPTWKRRPVRTPPEEVREKLSQLIQLVYNCTMYSDYIFCLGIAAYFKRTWILMNQKDPTGYCSAVPTAGHPTLFLCCNSKPLLTIQIC